MGSSTVVSGLACTPVVSSLSVQIATGRIYSLGTVDPTAYSDIGVDTADTVLKQGILLAPITLNCPAPVTAGNSINYLIEAQYQDSDTATAVLPYYNAANPSSALSGPGGLGTSQPTQRDGIISLIAKAGASATTGTQITPTVDAGYTGLWVVTIAYGQTSVVVGNIATAASAPFLTETLTQKISQTLADGRYARLTLQTAAEIAAGVVPTNYLYNADFMDPRRYGAVGDGVTDDTAALNKWVAVVNATTNPVSTWPVGLAFLCSPLNAITANNFTWHMNSTLLVKANSWSGLTSHAQINGTGARIYCLTINGNQAAFSAAPSGQLLSCAGNDVLLDSANLYGSGSRGALMTMAYGRFVNCHFDSNANLGIQMETVSYCKFVNCTFNFDGYGFQKTFATNTFSAFGFAMRYRSHHCEFINCEAMRCGRDGMNVNQGSYAVKFIGCLCWMNGDGGFTVAADNTSTGKLGESESPYDCEWIDCESYNNWTSGLAFYVASYNMTVDGGRYYNNNRLAGSATQASSYTNGIYVAAGSIGIRIRTKAYDDRQLCPITASSGAGPYVLTATGWVAGGMANYPNASVYNASFQFAGYATITAESAGSVTVTTTAFNGISGLPAVGYYVTQRVQHNGVFFDNNCQGEADVDGFGHLQGPIAAYMGFKTISGVFASGQNVRLPAVTLDYTELLANPTWDASYTTGWTYNLPGGGTASQTVTANQIRSPAALALVGGTSAAIGAATLITNGINYVNQGAWVEASVWCYATLPGDAQMVLFWGTTPFNSSVTHPGGGWRELRVGAYIPSGSTNCYIQVQASIGKTTYWDNASLRVRNETFDNRDFSYPTRNLAV